MKILQIRLGILRISRKRLKERVRHFLAHVSRVQITLSVRMNFLHTLSRGVRARKAYRAVYSPDNQRLSVGPRKREYKPTTFA